MFYRKRRLVTGTCEQLATRWQHKSASREGFLRASTVKRVYTIACDFSIDWTAAGQRGRMDRQLTHLQITYTHMLYFPR